MRIVSPRVSHANVRAVDYTSLRTVSEREKRAQRAARSPSQSPYVHTGQTQARAINYVGCGSSTSPAAHAISFCTVAVRATRIDLSHSNSVKWRARCLDRVSTGILEPLVRSYCRSVQ
jgi:hypothetical protein